MKVAILTQQIDNASCRNLRDALTERGIQVDFIQYENSVNPDQPESFVLHRDGLGRASLADKQNRPLDLRQYDGVMSRSWGAEPEAREFLAVFEQAGVVAANDVASILSSDSKLATNRRFAETGIPIPRTMEIDPGTSPEAMKAFLARRTPPYVLKLEEGSQGRGVRFFDSIEEVMKAAQELGEPAVLQQYVATGERQQSYRCFVVGNQALAAMRLTAPPGTNSSQGAQTELLDAVPPEIGALAVRAAAAMDLPISGVDIMIDANGKYYVLEANDSPKISTLVEEHAVPVHHAVAENFVGKITGRHQALAQLPTRDLICAMARNALRTEFPDARVQLQDDKLVIQGIPVSAEAAERTAAAVNTALTYQAPNFGASAILPRQDYQGTTLRLGHPQLRGPMLEEALAMNLRLSHQVSSPEPAGLQQPGREMAR